MEVLSVSTRILPTLPRNWFLFAKQVLGPGVDVASRDKCRLTRLFLGEGEGCPVRTLDVGCGNGYFSRCAARFGPVVAVTILPDEYAKAEELFNYLGVEVDLRLGKLEELHERDESFDQVLLLDVLEHIRDDRSALVQLHRLLRRDGFLFVSFPNRDSNFGPGKHVWRFETGWHVRHGYTFAGIERLLEDCGFEPVDRRAFGTYGSELSVRLQRRLGFRRSAPLLPFLRLLTYCLPAARHHTYLVVARKRT